MYKKVWIKSEILKLHYEISNEEFHDASVGEMEDRLKMIIWKIKFQNFMINYHLIWLFMLDMIMMRVQLIVIIHINLIQPIYPVRIKLKILGIMKNLNICPHSI